MIRIVVMSSVVEPEPDFLSGAGAGEKAPALLLLFGLVELWWQSREVL